MTSSTETQVKARRGRARQAAPVEIAEGGLHRAIGPVGLLFTAVGSIIGSGWLFGALYASQTAGPAAVVSWAIGGVMILFIGLVYAELGAMYPVSGGVVRFPHFSHGSLTSYSVGWITWLAAVTVAPIEVEAALQYAQNYFPHFVHKVGGTPVLTWPVGYGTAAALMLLFSLVNIVGVRAFARFNNVLVWWKLGVITLVIVTLFVAGHFSGSHFTAFGGFMPYGQHGVFTAIATSGVVFSYLGFRQGVELAGESRNPSRNVPLAVIGSVLIAMVIYVALQIAFIGTVPGHLLDGGWAKLSFSNDFGPLAGVSLLLGLSWLAYILYADAFISPADTGLIYTTVTSRIAYGMGRNRNAPHALSRLSRRGVPWVSVILTFLVGLAIFLPFPGWQKLVGFITSATVLSFGSGPIALLSLRRQMPDAARPFRLPAAWLVAFLAFYSSNLIVYWTGWDINYKLFAAIGIGFLLLAVHEVVQRRRGDVPPSLEWRAFAWVPLWLGGLAVVSWLGSYGAGRGVLTFESAFPVIAVFSALVMWVGVQSRLRRDVVERNIAEARMSNEEAYPEGE